MLDIGKQQYLQNSNIFQALVKELLNLVVGQQENNSLTSNYIYLIIHLLLILGMKVFALVSGGKDSIFNIHKCIDNGHEIIALGNLYNVDQQLQCEGIENDSYMYQTVGSNITLAIAEAMNKPIIRKLITGTPKVTNLQYHATQEEKKGDEVEDLYDLVIQAKVLLINNSRINFHRQMQSLREQYFPLTKNQECKRLGLTSLAYLWQRDQVQLLKQMVEYPINAIIIKVASYGLKVGHLGKTIGELLPYFMKMKDQCGMNVCGEGGQFQSLVLDCPLFKKKICIDQKQVIQIDKNQIAPVAYLKILKFHLQNK